MWRLYYDHMVEERELAGRRDDHTIPQDWHAYTADEHAIWSRLFARQSDLLPGRASALFLAGLDRFRMAATGIPEFKRLNDILRAATGWQVVAVPGLVPDDVFFAHLAARRFPAARFIRRADQLDYIEAPDVFHDVFGHVPMLLDPNYGDFMQAYGRAGIAADGVGLLKRLARLYWYTVEFGLMSTPAGLRIFGAGIVSSPAESVFALDDPSPNRIRFDLKRVMRTNYRIDDFQETYFVIDDTAALIDAVNRDLTPAFAQLAHLPDLTPRDVLADDVVLTRGTGAYARRAVA